MCEGQMGEPKRFGSPFNPETWIPFELSQDTEVTVGIMMYRASGYGNYS